MDIHLNLHMAPQCLKIDDYLLALYNQYLQNII
jgi:hypothetical protein